MQRANDPSSRSGVPEEWAPHPVTIGERFRRIPEAVLLTAGYCASRVPAMGEIIRRLD